MDLSRSSDQMLDGMKSLADRLIREKQKAFDQAEFYRFKLQESNAQRQHADKEIFASSKLVAQQKVKIQEGDTFLKTLQDKVKVFDIHQETLHKEISSLETTILELSKELSNYSGSFKDQFQTFQDDLSRATDMIQDLEHEIGRLHSIEEGLNASLRDKEKERQAIEDGFAKANDSWSAEKATLVSTLNDVKAQCLSMTQSFEAKLQAAADEKEVLDSSLNAYKASAESIQAELEKALEALTCEKADMQDQLCATQQQLQEKIIEKDHIACKLKTELSICKTELSDLKDEHETQVAIAQQCAADLEARLGVQNGVHIELEERFNLLEVANKAGQTELQIQSKLLQEESTKHSALLWAEKDKIKRLQDNFVEQYDKLGKAHAKEVKTLQEKLDQHQQDLTQLEDLMAKQSTDLRKHESFTAALEAEKTSQAALHKAEIEKLQQQLQDVKTRERESQLMHEHRLEATKAALEAQSSCSREAALTTELMHSKSMTNLQKSFQSQIAHFNLQIEMAKSEREEALVALDDASKQIHQDHLDHNEAMRSLSDSKDQAIETASHETTFLKDQLTEKEAQLDGVRKQLCDKENSLEAMQAQARKREQILSNLRQNLQYREEVLNCISSAAATMKRPTPAKGKSYGIPPLQPEGVLDLDQQVRKRHTKKRKQQGLDPSTKPTQAGHYGGQALLAEHITGKSMQKSRRSGKSKFTTMSAKPANCQEAVHSSTAMGLFGSDIAVPYDWSK